MWTLVIFVYMTRGALVEVQVPTFESRAACVAAGRAYKAEGLSSVVISESFECRQTSR